MMVIVQFFSFTRCHTWLSARSIKLYSLKQVIGGRFLNFSYNSEFIHHTFFEIANFEKSVNGR